jgi:uncharacterized membrane protein
MFKVSYEKFLGLLVTVFGTTGLYASIALLLTKIERLKNPGFIPTCTSGSWFDCSRVMDTKWGSLLNYPNYINGIALYSLAIMTGLFILSNKTNDKKVMWFAMLLSGCGLFINFNLLYISSFLIYAICLWCVLSIISTMGIFFAIVDYNIKQGHLGQSKKVEYYQKKVHIPLMFVLYCLIFFMVFAMKYMASWYPEFFDIAWPDPAFWL